MISRFGFCKITQTAILGYCFCKSIATSSISLTSLSNCESNKLVSLTKDTSAPSHISSSIFALNLTLVESILALKYSKADLLRILKIFLKTKSQKPNAEIPCE